MTVRVGTPPLQINLKHIRRGGALLLPKEKQKTGGVEPRPYKSCHVERSRNILKILRLRAIAQRLRMTK